MAPCVDKMDQAGWTSKSGKGLKELIEYYEERTQKDSGRRRTRGNTISNLEAALCNHYNARRAEYDRLVKEIARYRRTRRDPENALHRSLDDLYYQAAARPAEADYAVAVDDDPEIELVNAQSEYTHVDGGYVSWDGEEVVDRDASPHAAGPVQVKTEPVHNAPAVSLTHAAYPHADLPPPTY